MDKPKWKRTAPLGLCSDTMTMLQALAELWLGKPAAKRLKVSVVLTHLIPDGDAQRLPFDEPHRRDRLARAMDKIYARYGQRLAYFFTGFFGDFRQGVVAAFFCRILGRLLRELGRPGQFRLGLASG